MASAGLTGGQSDVQVSLRQMRQQSRKLARDNEHARRYFQLLRDNVIGPRGLQLQMRVTFPRGEPDELARGRIEAAYAAFGRRGSYTACGTWSRRCFDRAALTCAARDGEVLIEVLRGRRWGAAGIAFRLLDADFLDDSLTLVRGASLSVPDSSDRVQGVEVRAGVELDDWGRPLAYWLRDPYPGATTRHRRRVPARDIVHRFAADDQRIGTTRGVPWLYVAMRRLTMLGGYEEASLANARAGASKMGFYKQPESALGSSVGGGLADGTQVASGEEGGELLDRAEAGTFGVLPPGWDFQPYDPSYPNDSQPDFVKHLLRAFSAGVGLQYNIVSSDLEGVSYSSMRQGALSDRDTYEAIQQWYIEEVAQALFRLWLQSALEFGQLGALLLEDYDRLDAAHFVPRSWKWVDPLKEAQAAEMLLRLRLTSRTRLCAEHGVDFADLLAEISREEQLAAEYGVSLAAVDAAVSQVVSDATIAPTDEPADGVEEDVEHAAEQQG